MSCSVAQLSGWWNFRTALRGISMLEPNGAHFPFSACAGNEMSRSWENSVRWDGDQVTAPSDTREKCADSRIGMSWMCGNRLPVSWIRVAAGGGHSSVRNISVALLGRLAGFEMALGPA